IIVAILGLIPLAVAQRCNADNCARRVTGTFRAAGVPDVTNRGLDCSSYMQTAVIPDTFTSTVTTTIYTDNIPTNPTTTFSQSTTRAAITQSPTSVPSYAAVSCTSTGAYSSACSCWGYIPSIKTLPAPVAIVTAT
ncbi:uncharacterized protein BDZ83DRAFT_545000, partial [Colletotrichum acutatum]